MTRHLIPNPTQHANTQRPAYDSMTRRLIPNSHMICRYPETGLQLNDKTSHPKFPHDMPTETGLQLNDQTSPKGKRERNERVSRDKLLEKIFSGIKAEFISEKRATFQRGARSQGFEHHAKNVALRVWRAQSSADGTFASCQASHQPSCRIQLPLTVIPLPKFNQLIPVLPHLNRILLSIDRYSSSYQSTSAQKPRRPYRLTR